MPEVMPVHPFTGLAALGVLPSGRVVWPVLGGAPDDDAGDDNGHDGAGDGDDSGAGDGQGGDDLGDKGRAALAKERQARREAEKARKAAEKELADFRAAQQAKKDGDDTAAAAEQARRDAEAAAKAKADKRIASAELRALATGKFADPADAPLFIDISQFEVDDEGNVDREAMAEAISEALKKKPHLAAKASGFEGGDSGGGSASRRQLTREQLKGMSPAAINKAREEGRLDRLLNGS